MNINAVCTAPLHNRRSGQERRMTYLMENDEEIIRLEVKTNVDEVRQQAVWCGIRQGQRVLDVGCGIGKTTAVLYDMVQPAGSVVGIDFSEDRISYAKKYYGEKEGIDFYVTDLTKPVDNLGCFDVIWVRFVLEYFRAESNEIVKNLRNCLAPGGVLCLLDLDHNCLNHYELPNELECILYQVMERMEKEHNFDTRAGRKLYSYLYDNGFENIEANIMAHHLIYGDVREEDLFNWMKKTEVAASMAKDLFDNYPGGFEGFHSEFMKFFNNPRRFTYSCLILCKGRKPR